MENKIQALFFTNGTASHRWRIDGIANRLNREPDHAIYVTDWKAWNDHFPEGTNLVILELIGSKNAVESAKSVGAKVILEADDAWIDSWKEDRKNLGKFVGSARDEVIETLKAVDAITVTSEVLKENYARFTDKPIYVLPNYVDYEWYGEDTVNVPRTTDEVRIGWFGSQGHLEDLHMVIPALNRVLAKYPNAKFVYCGFGGMSSDSMVTQAIWGEDVFKDVPRDRREYYMGIDEEYWPIKHRLLSLDIGIAPLIDDYFNKCKTPIKWMEYGILGVPSVVSPTLYGDYVKDGVDGYIANTEDEWVEKLSKLIEDAQHRKEMGKQVRERVKREYNLDDRYKKWEQIYLEIINS